MNLILNVNDRGNKTISIMSKKIENLRDLFIEQGRELIDAFKQEQKELPKIQKWVNNSRLKDLIVRELNTTKLQNFKIEQAFKNMNVGLEGEKNQCCESIFKQTKKYIERSSDTEVRDAAILNAIQRLNHNKITGFGSLAAYANEIGKSDLAKSLHETLEDEKSIDMELTKLAENEINKIAVSAKAV